MLLQQRRLPHQWLVCFANHGFGLLTLLSAHCKMQPSDVDTLLKEVEFCIFDCDGTLCLVQALSASDRWCHS